MPVAVLLIAAAGVAWLVASKPVVAPEAQEERVWTVATRTVALRDVQPELRLFGQIVAGREVELRALVAGEVLEVGPQVVEGGTVQTGELIVAIDDFDYRAAVDEQAALIREAEARLAEISAMREATAAALTEDRTLLTLRERDVERVEKLLQRRNVSDKAVDVARMDLARQEQNTALRRNQLTAEDARIRQQEAILDRLRVSLRRARRDLENTRLEAPFGGFLFDVAAQSGKRLNVNDQVARLIDAGRLEVKLTLSDAQYGRLIDAADGIAGRPVQVFWRVGTATLAFTATLDRAAARIDAASGGVDIYARLVDSGPAQPLRPGAFVEVRLKDRPYVGVVQLPESALYGAGLVYVVVDGRLQTRRVEQVGRVGDDVLLRGELADGDVVVVTQYAEIGPGQRVSAR